MLKDFQFFLSLIETGMVVLMDSKGEHEERGQSCYHRDYKWIGGTLDQWMMEELTSEWLPSLYLRKG